ncbi:A disintegrin and metalloproteinase with thrombospondin motifs 7 [Lasioglossum baleicum]|uniref:A disintegrin and metalloproteinase with thrombospondin motifs 7 n=1 Tax=Lasioglossum baleicum TaxID=434251 RepID=UPI003FCDF183
MNGFQAFLTFFCVLVITDGDLIEKYRGAGNVYHESKFCFSGGHHRYTRDIHEPEFLIPRRVFEDGSFSTYTLPNFYDRTELSARKKRSAEEGKEDSREDKLHLVLPFKGQEHHVELDPYHDFISPDMVIETRGAGLRTNPNEAIRFKRVSDDQCHYRGFVRGHERSKAALSLCDGVVGYVQTDHGRYYIEPVSESEPESDGRHVHIVYERSVPHEVYEKGGHKLKPACGVSDNWEAAWAEALADREKQRLTEKPEKRETIPLGMTHSIHRYLTIGLVADRQFLDFHNNTNYEQYLLTIMNMVSDYYHDVSTGNQIDVIVVRMIYLEKEKEEIDLHITPEAQPVLINFTRWVEKLKPADENHPNHFDAAVLVTRYDLCDEEEDCNLLGLAYVSDVCKKNKAGCINEDNGLTLGITIAHELGHMLGCSHDSGKPGFCIHKDEDGSCFVMSPYVFPFTIRWSNCSRYFMTQLFSKGLGDCLSNSPRNPPENFKFPNMLPGAMYDADYQCKTMAPDADQCKTYGCEKLWCNINGTCRTRQFPLYDGTKCGENKWCIHKECVEMGVRPKAVHGGWSEWGAMGACSRTCGGGLHFSERECNKPIPANGGRYCLGERRRIKICNTQPCDPKKPPLRALLCSSFDKKKILDNDFHTWKPLFEVKNPCYLLCVNEKNAKMVLMERANDTTPCRPGTNDMCINGVCKKVSCDWKIGGTAVTDVCGICKGDGTKCTKIEGYANKTLPTSKLSIYRSYEYPSGDYECADAMLIYTHPEPTKEEINIKSAISQDIVVEVEFHGRSFNRFLVYWSYYVLSSNPSYTPKYLWDFTEWTICDARCGGGTMTADPTCIEQKGGKVTASFCDSIPKPEPKSRVCNAHPCPAKWRVSQWSRCSACGGKTGLKRRKVQCVKPAARKGEDDVQANFDACKGRVPKQQDECVGDRPCRKTCAKWVRNIPKSAEKQHRSIPVEKRAKIIDAMVDLNLARYLEKSYGLPSGAHEMSKLSDSSDYRQVIRDWSALREDKSKRTCPQMNLTLPEPGSIVVDTAPMDSFVLAEAPYLDESLQQNLSDQAYHEAGDMVGVSLDTSRQKVYRGKEAIKKLREMMPYNDTARSSKEESLTYDRLARLVDPENQ